MCAGVLCTRENRSQNRQQHPSSQLKAHVGGEGCFPTLSKRNPPVALDRSAAALLAETQRALFQKKGL